MIIHVQFGFNQIYSYEKSHFFRIHILNLCPGMVAILHVVKDHPSLLSMISWFQIKIIFRDQYKKYPYKGTIPLHMQFLRIFFNQKAKLALAAMLISK